MQLGMIGLGRMGANIVRRLMRAGHECVVYDVSEAAIVELESEGATGARSLAELARIKGVGPAFVERHGQDVLTLVGSASQGETSAGA